MLVASVAAFAQSKVYLTREITPESLVKIYKTLGVPAKRHGSKDEYRRGKQS